jgi:hypothetical protein
LTPLFGEDLGPYRRRIEGWVEQGHSTLEIAAVLLKLADSREGTSRDRSGRVKER